MNASTNKNTGNVTVKKTLIYYIYHSSIHICKVYQPMHFSMLAILCFVLILEAFMLATSFIKFYNPDSWLDPRKLGYYGYTDEYQL
jgi:hypothetical protein